jgi:predicted nucleic acid-binding protein
MEIYCDTSALVALLTSEPSTPTIKQWFTELDSTLVCADWGYTEFHSAIAIKIRTGQLAETQATETLALLELLSSGGLRWIPVSRSAFRAAAHLVDEHQHGLRGGDALHLAVARELGIKHFATLDANQRINAERLGLLPELF